MLEMRLLIFPNNLYLIFETQRQKLATGLATSDLETPVPQDLS